MSIFEAMILGLIQGLTEFLPVSSSGHLILFEKILGISEPTANYDVLLHVATLIPVVFIFWKEIFALIKNPFQKTTYLLIIGTIPTIIIALLFKDQLGGDFIRNTMLGFNFIITGILLLLADKRKPGKKKVSRMTYVDAAIIGTMQGVAITPAISRSGMTITTSLFRGLDKKNAAKYSFLMSIPAILGALVLSVKDILTGTAAIEKVDIFPMICGFVVAMLSGYLAINYMLEIIRNKKLSIFSIYLFILGGIVILDRFMFHLKF